MSKTKTRLIIVITAIVTIISTFCYAETNQTAEANVENTNQTAVAVENNEDGVMPINEPVSEDSDDSFTPADGARTEEPDSTPVPTDGTNETPINNETSTNEDTTTPNIHNGDLYLFDSNVTMDQLVDGNVFIFGNNIKITGQCSGNIFVFGNNVTFDKAYVQASAFVFGNKVTYNCVSTALYCAAAELTIDNQFGVYSDMYVACDKLNYSGITGRNAFIDVNEVNFGETGVFYGDLNYTSPKEVELREGLVSGATNYTKTKEKEKKTIGSYVKDLVMFLVFLTIMFLVIKLFTKSPETKEESTLSHPFKTFGIGLLTVIIVPIIAVVLLFTVIGLLPSVYLLGVYIYMLFFAKFIFSISLARYICIGKKSRGIKEFLLSVLIYAILWLLGLIPFVGGFVGFVTGTLGFGVMIYTPLMKKALASNKTKTEVEKTKDESPIKDSQTSKNEDKKEE